MSEDDERSQILERVTGDVLEQCAFLLAVRAQRIAEWYAKDPLHAVVEFKGPRTGWLRLSAPRALLTLISADMIGDDTIERESVAAATLAELTNIIAGALLGAVFGGGASYQLAIPRAHTEPPAIPAFAERSSVTLVTETAQPLEAELVLLARGPA